MPTPFHYGEVFRHGPTATTLLADATKEPAAWRLDSKTHYSTSAYTSDTRASRCHLNGPHQAQRLKNRPSPEPPPPTKALAFALFLRKSQPTLFYIETSAS